MNILSIYSILTQRGKFYYNLLSTYTTTPSHHKPAIFFGVLSGQETEWFYTVDKIMQSKVLITN
ncbi:hypothetical protein [Flavobacterium sp. WC2416]|uniref:Uncharacterized protein n=1 Tax=Flavobacterium sp. WC2416 TaxID=3234141 RepID=A0AB39WBE3_9FLAO